MMNALELKELRIRAGIPQKTIAQMLCRSKSYISEIESGKRKLTASIIDKYNEAIASLTPNSLLNCPNAHDCLSCTILEVCVDTIYMAVLYGLKNHNKQKLQHAVLILNEVKGNRSLEAKLHTCIAKLYHTIQPSDLGKALKHIEIAIQIYRSNQSEFPLEYAIALCVRGSIYLHKGDAVIAEDIFRYAQHIFVKNDQPFNMIRYICLSILVSIATRLDRTDALELMNTFETLREQIEWVGDSVEEQKLLLYGISFSARANIAKRNGDFYKAISEYKTFVETVDPHLFELRKDYKVNALTYIGCCYKKLNNFEKAEQYLLEAIELDPEHQTIFEEYSMYNYLTACYLGMGRYVDAMRTAQSIMNMEAETISNKTMALLHMGRIYHIRDNDKNQYRNCLQQAIELIIQNEAYEKQELYLDLIDELGSIDTTN